MLTRWLVVGLLSGAFLLPAVAHNDAQWIQDGAYKNKIYELCCGIADCGQKISGAVIAMPDGFKVDAVFRITPRFGDPIDEEVHEFVPTADATPSIDGIYWRCRWGGGRKCFFYPMPGS